MNTKQWGSMIETFYIEACDPRNSFTLSYLVNGHFMSDKWAVSIEHLNCSPISKYFDTAEDAVEWLTNQLQRLA